MTSDRIRLEGPAWANTPTVVDDTVYIGTRTGFVQAIRDGTDIWTTEVGDPIEWSSVATTEEYVYAATTSGNVFALNRESGDQQWQFDEGVDFEQTSPVVVGDTVFIGDGEDGGGDFYALDRETGDLLWTHVFETQTDWNDPMPPVVVDDVMYVAHGDAIDALAPGDHELREIGQPIPPDAARGMLEKIQEHRGFFTNDPDSEIAVIDDPIAMTWLGMGVSVAGIAYSMYKTQR